MDYFLHGYERNLPSFIKHMGEFLKRIYNLPWREDYLLITLDVTSLYTSINHNDWIHALEHFLKGWSLKLLDGVLKITTFSSTRNSVDSYMERRWTPASPQLCLFVYGLVGEAGAHEQPWCYVWWSCHLLVALYWWLICYMEGLTTNSWSLHRGNQPKQSELTLYRSH